MSHTARQWDERYAAAGDGPDASVWTTAPNTALAATLTTELADVQPGTCVDVAAGEGRHAVWLAGLGWQVVAVDFSQVGLERADRFARVADVAVRTVCADVTTWAPSEQVDLVLCAYLHLGRSTMDLLLRRLAGWVAPGGRLVLLGHDRDNLARGSGGPQDIDVLWDGDQLRDAAASADLVTGRVEQVLRPVDGAARPAVDVLCVATRPPG